MRGYSTCNRVRTNILTLSVSYKILLSLPILYCTFFIHSHDYSLHGTDRTQKACSLVLGNTEGIPRSLMTINPNPEGSKYINIGKCINPSCSVYNSENLPESFKQRCFLITEFPKFQVIQPEPEE